MSSQDILHTLETLHKRLLRLETGLGMNHEVVIKAWKVTFDGTMDHSDKKRAQESGAHTGNNMLRLVKISENQHVLEYSNGYGSFIYKTNPFYGNPNSVFDTSKETLSLHIHGYHGGAGSLSTNEKFAVFCPDRTVVKFFVHRP